MFPVATFASWGYTTENKRLGRKWAGTISSRSRVSAVESSGDVIVQIGHDVGTDAPRTQREG